MAFGHETKNFYHAMNDKSKIKIVDYENKL